MRDHLGPKHEDFINRNSCEYYVERSPRFGIFDEGMYTFLNINYLVIMAHCNLGGVLEKLARRTNDIVQVSHGYHFKWGIVSFDVSKGMTDQCRLIK